MELNIINSCYSNLNCKDCYIVTNLPIVGSVLNKRKLVDIFEHFKAKGFNKVTFMGGEPLLDTYRLYQIVSLASKYFGNIRIITNGILLNKEFARELVSAGVKKFTFNVFGINNDMFNNVAGINKKLEIPVDIIKYVNELCDTVIYMPLFEAYQDSILLNFTDILDQTKVNKVTFISTKQDQFSSIEFYKNIKISSQLISTEDDYLEIYDTSKYKIGFMDVFKYINKSDKYYLFPDLVIRTNLFDLSDIYEIV